LADAATTIVFALIIYQRIAETRPVTTRSAAANPEAIVRESAMTDKVLLSVVGLNALFALVYFQNQSTLPIVMGRSGLGPPAYGLALSASSVLVIVLELPVITLLSGSPRDLVLAAGALAIGIGFWLTAFRLKPR
jgi:hypothetical protein